MRSSRIRASLLGVLAVALAGCAGATRIATDNATSQISGQTVATKLEQRLAGLGLAGASVSCAKSVIVNVGPQASCKLSRNGTSKTVTFTFKTLDGKVDLPSVKVS